MPAHIVELNHGFKIASCVGAAGASRMVIHGEQSVLIDCHSDQLNKWLEYHGLPEPQIILHTHVQPDNCREGHQFPNASVRVHEDVYDLACQNSVYTTEAETIWDNPEEWGETMGREKYGIAGCVTEFPPVIPLSVDTTFSDGEAIRWQEAVLTVFPLPGHGKSHVGFLFEVNDEVLAVFTGDLLCRPAHLVNMYDLEKNYGGTALPEIPGVLRSLAEKVRAEQHAGANPVPFFPSTGRSIRNGPEQALVLADKIDRYSESLDWQSGEFTPPAPVEYPAAGRYLEVHQGVYQINNSGNCIVFIDDEGRGMMVDPGPCDFDSPRREEEFRADMEFFEQHGGLKKIDLMLITHIHGDHYDMAPVVQELYPGCRLAAWDWVARVIDAPWDYNFPALLPWYGIGMKHVAVDDVLFSGEPYYWHQHPLLSFHLPGHCYCHAGYMIDFNGKKITLTGDSVQNRGEAQGIGGIICNGSFPGMKAGHLKSHRTLLELQADLNLGGHGSHFSNCRELHTESIKQIEHALSYLKALLPDNDIQAAFQRYDLKFI